MYEDSKCVSVSMRVCVMEVGCSQGGTILVMCVTFVLDLNFVV